MDDLKKVRRRIAERRLGFDDDEAPKGNALFRLLYRTVMLLMFVCAAVLGILVNQKLHLIQMPAVLENFKIDDISSWLPFENWFSLKDQAVSAAPAYTKVGDGQYKNDSNSVYNLSDGTVLHIQMLDNGKNSIVMKQDNGVIATYDGVMDVAVKEEERILKDKILGTYDAQVGISFLKDQKKLDMNEALQP